MKSEKVFKKGETIFHLGRQSYYKVLSDVQIKSDNIWVSGIAYQCQKSGKVYVRPDNMFGNFIRVPVAKSIWERVKCFFSF